MWEWNYEMWFVFAYPVPLIPKHQPILIENLKTRIGIDSKSIYWLCFGTTQGTAGPICFAFNMYRKPQVQLGIFNTCQESLCMHMAQVSGCYPCKETFQVDIAPGDQSEYYRKFTGCRLCRRPPKSDDWMFWWILIGNGSFGASNPDFCVVQSRRGLFFASKT